MRGCQAICCALMLLLGVQAAARSQGVPKPGAPLREDNRVYLENADTLRLDESDVAIATGNVRIRYRNYRITSDNAVLDPTSGVAVFSGNAKMWSTESGMKIDAVGPATTISVNLRQGTYYIHGSESGVMPPSQAGMGLMLPVFISGDDVDGKPDTIDMRNANITTCDFDKPHYKFIARSVHIRPGKRLVARHVDLIRRDSRILTLPIVVLPLDDRYMRSQYIPEIGESSTEGYFAKFAIPYALDPEKTGIARIDIMQKKGTGYGIDQDYIPPLSLPGSPDGTGQLKLYYLKDKSTDDISSSGTLMQTEEIVNGYNMQLGAQYQQNSYLLSETKSLNESGLLNLNRSNRAGSTSYSGNYTANDYGQGRTENTSQSLTQQWNTFHSGTAQIKLGLADSTAQATNSNLETLTSQTTLATKTGGYQWQVEVDKNAQLANSSGSNAFTSVTREPEFSIATTPPQQNDTSFVLKALPFLTTAGAVFGKYDDPSASMNTTRSEFTLKMDDKSSTHKSLLTSYSADFQQDFYGDNTARYILDGKYGEDYGLGKNSSFLVDYNYLRQYGYTPFVFDQATDMNMLNATLALQQHKAIGLNLQTGYDITRATEQNGIPAAPWSDLSAQLVLRPSSVVANRISPVLDLNTGLLVSLTDDFRIATKWGFTYLSTITYDTTLKVIESITNDVTLPIVLDKREETAYNIRFLDGYNGYTHTITYYGAELTRSWHDYELSGVVEQNIGGAAGGGQVYFLTIHLKAFPAFSPFGVSDFGQGISTGSGQVF